MTKNLGTADRTIRTLLAVAVGALMLTGIVSGTLAVILGVVAAVLLLTSAMGYCPLYALLRISSRGKNASVPERV